MAKYKTASERRLMLRDAEDEMGIDVGETLHITIQANEKLQIQQGSQKLKLSDYEAMLLGEELIKLTT